MQAGFDLIFMTCDIAGHLRGNIYTPFGSQSMKPSEFKYECPETLDDALTLLCSDEHDCQPLAGGQSLMPMMNLRLAGAELLVDLNNVRELDFIREEGLQISIGSMVRYATLIDSDIISQHIPLFSLAIPHIAHEAIRNRGTIGGSVALADPAAEMPALLMALDATIVAVSKTGKREISADEFFIGVYETALETGELVHSIKIPVAGVDQKFGFYELARRHGDYAMAGVAIAASSIDPYADLRIVFFSIGDRALRATEAEVVLQGQRYGEESVHNAQLALASLQFNEDMNASESTKAHLAGVVMQRALADMNVENT